MYCRVGWKTVVESGEKTSSGDWGEKCCGEWVEKLKWRVRRKTVVKIGEENCCAEWEEKLVESGE